MNYLHHPNLLVQFWAALNTEFDKILDQFVRGDGWLFQDLSVTAKKCNIASISRCVPTTINLATNGITERLDHFVRVNFVILDAAKTQWLVPWRSYVVDPSTGVIPPFLKRQIGGFFLLYMLYSSQNTPNRFGRKQRILMDARDLLAMHVFNATIQRLRKGDDQFRELARQIVVIFNDLVKGEAFEFCTVSDTLTTINTSCRKLLGLKLCNLTKMMYKLKDIRDQLHYITYQESPKTFRALIAYGKLMTMIEGTRKVTDNEEQATSSAHGRSSKRTQNSNKHSKKEQNQNQGDATKFHPKDCPWTIDEITALRNENDIGVIAHSIPCILKSLDFGQILNRDRLTGVTTEFLDREMEHCAKVHRNRMKSNDMYKRRKHAKSDENASEKDLGLRVWKQYLQQDNSWVDEIIKSNRSSEPKQEKCKDVTEEPEKLGADVDKDVELEELETDSEEYESEIDDLEIPRTEENPKKTLKTPTKDSENILPYFSMPNVLTNMSPIKERTRKSSGRSQSEINLSKSIDTRKKTAPAPESPKLSKSKSPQSNRRSQRRRR